MTIIHKIFIVIANLLALVLILVNFYPEPYVDENKMDYERILYKPNTFELRLLNNSIIKIDTACSKIDKYRNGRTQYSYNFRIPIKDAELNKITFDFEILDKSNKNSATGLDAECKVISLIELRQKLVVILEQKNPAKGVGWKQPIITDTIIFERVFSETREPGYYGDSNCDCIEH